MTTVSNHAQVSVRVQPPANTNIQEASGQLAGRNVLFQQVVAILSSSITRPLALLYIDSLSLSALQAWKG